MEDPEFVEAGIHAARQTLVYLESLFEANTQLVRAVLNAYRAGLVVTGHLIPEVNEAIVVKLMEPTRIAIQYYRDALGNAEEDAHKDEPPSGGKLN